MQAGSPSFRRTARSHPWTSRNSASGARSPAMRRPMCTLAGSWCRATRYCRFPSGWSSQPRDPDCHDRAFTRRQTVMSYMGYPMYWDYQRPDPHHDPHAWYPWTGYPWSDDPWAGYSWHGHGRGWDAGWPGYAGGGRHEHRHEHVVLPQEVLAGSLDATTDPSPNPSVVFIGGIAPCRLTLEYLPRGATTPHAIEVAITDSGTTTTWSDPDITSDYNVKSDFWPVRPGDQISIKVTNAVARLRWCEIVER